MNPAILVDSLLGWIRNKPFWVLLPLLGLHLGYYFWAGPFFAGSDDLAYAQIADSIRAGTYQLKPHMFYNRFGATAITAIIFQIFGINLYTTTLWPLLCSLLLVVAVHQVTARIFGGLAGFFAGLLVATNPMHITYALMLMTDGPLSLMTFLSAAFLYFARQAQSSRHQISLGMLFSLFFTLAFISKCSVLWAFPFIVGLMLFDLIHKRHVRMWLAISLSGTVLALLYFGTYYVYTGNVLYRFSGVDQLFDPNNQLNAKQARDYFINKPLSDYIKRLTYQPLQMFFATPSIIIPLLLAWPALLHPFRTSKTLPDSVRFWAFFSWSIILSFWFGSNSTHYYTPFGLYDYYMLPVTPILCLLGGVILATLTETVLQTGQGNRLLWILTSVIVLVVPIQKLLMNEKLGIVLIGLPLIVLALGARLLQNPLWKQSLLPAGVIVMIAILYPMVPAVPIWRGYIGETSVQKAERYLIQKYMANPSTPTIILTDHRTPKVIKYYLSFNPPPSLRLINWEDAAKIAIQKQERIIYFVHKGRLQALMGTYNQTIPEFVRKPPSDWQLLESRQGISVYEARQIIEPSSRRGVPLFDATKPISIN
ncbi:MAG: glycosyltransferase family 39 protein [Magnetococcus sp. YQC-5]